MNSPHGQRHAICGPVADKVVGKSSRASATGRHYTGPPTETPATARRRCLFARLLRRELGRAWWSGGCQNLPKGVSFRLTPGPALLHCLLVTLKTRLRK
jgi:hypothetical protein